LAVFSKYVSVILREKLDTSSNFYSGVMVAVIVSNRTSEKIR